MKELNNFDRKWSMMVFYFNIQDIKLAETRHQNKHMYHFLLSVSLDPRLIDDISYH